MFFQEMSSRRINIFQNVQPVVFFQFRYIRCYPGLQPVADNLTGKEFSCVKEIALASLGLNGQRKCI